METTRISRQNVQTQNHLRSVLASSSDHSLTGSNQFFPSVAFWFRCGRFGYFEISDITWKKNTSAREIVKIRTASFLNYL